MQGRIKESRCGRSMDWAVCVELHSRYEALRDEACLTANDLRKGRSSSVIRISGDENVTATPIASANPLRPRNAGASVLAMQLLGLVPMRPLDLPRGRTTQRGSVGQG